jgi:arginyl-tRNA synthetase
LTESDLAKKNFLLHLSRLVEVQLAAALELLEIEFPEKMSRSVENGSVPE